MSDLNVHTTAEINALTPITGDLVIDSDLNAVKLYDGTAWKTFDSDIVFENRWGVSLDGVNDYLSRGTTTSEFNYWPFSACAWVKQDTVKNNVIFYRRTGINGMQITILNSGQVQYYGGSARNFSANVTSLNRWYHIAITHDGSDVICYIDGQSVGSFSDTPIPVASAEFTVGGHPTDATRKFSGSIDEAAFFNTTLSAADITKIYNSGAPTDLTLAASYDTDRTSNLKGYWKMGDDSNDSATSGGSISTITDSSGNGNDVTQSTASSQPTFKALAQSVGTTLSFDGSNDYLTVTQNSDINITGDLTVSAWVRLSQISGYNAVLTKRAVSGSMNYQFTINSSGKIGLGHSGGSWVYDTNSLTVDTWHHVAATVSSGTVQFYIDGVAKSSDTGLTITGDTNDLTIGATVGYNYFSGTINEVAIFSTALSTSDITSLAASQTAHIVNDLSLSPVAYYRMGEDDSLTDGASASQITDASGNGNHATQATAANQPTASIEPIIYV